MNFGERTRGVPGYGCILFHLVIGDDRRIEAIHDVWDMSVNWQIGERHNTPGNSFPDLARHHVRQIQRWERVSYTSNNFLMNLPEILNAAPIAEWR